MAGPGKGKQATKGQKQIVDENRSTIQFYMILSGGFTSFYVIVMSVFFFEQLFGQFKYIFYILVSAGINLACISMFQYMARPTMNQSGHIVDGGIDLNMEGGFAEYFKDIIILNCFIQLLSLYSNYMWWLWLAVPGMACYKLCVNLILPWIFAPAPDDGAGGGGGDGLDERNEKKQRKLERKMRRSGM